MKASKAQIKALEAGNPCPPTEAQVQAEIVNGLRLHGYLALVTSRRVKKCQKCGTYAASGTGDGASKGLADLLVRRPSWPRGSWLSLEVKAPGPVKYSSQEQRIYAEQGDIMIVQSFEQALATVRLADLQNPGGA